MGSDSREKRVGSGRSANTARTWLAWTLAYAAWACSPGHPPIELPAPNDPAAWHPAAWTEPAAPRDHPPTASVRGEIRWIERSSAPPPPLGPVVVYLRTAPGEASSGRSRETAAREGSAPIPIASWTEAFSPPLVAVPWGRTVTLANEGPLVHRLFSAAVGDGRAIDLPPGTRSAPLALPAAGPIRFFCALHAEESFVVFAARTPWVAVVRAPGEPFRFDGIPAGRYALGLWSEELEGPVRNVVVDGYSRLHEPVWLDPALVRTADRGPWSPR